MAQVKIINAGIGQMPRILRVAPYCRFSTNSADQLNSYATQIRVYIRMVEQRKKQDVWSGNPRASRLHLNKYLFVPTY